MRKIENKVEIRGYVYSFNPDRFAVKVTGEKSKNPGVQFITGDLEIAVDEAGLNVIPVRFTYVTPVYAKSGKQNRTFSELVKIIEHPEKTWVNGGKENAYKVSIDGRADLNIFPSRQDGRMVEAKQISGSFLTIVDILPIESERNTFNMDMWINKARMIEADPEKNIAEDYMVISGGIFNDYSKEFLPFDLSLHNDEGMKYIENMGIEDEPVFTRLWGKIEYTTVTVQKTEESAWGEVATVGSFARKNREWIVTGTAKVPYTFGPESEQDEDNKFDLTHEEVKAGKQAHETHLAEVKRKDDEYQATRSAAPAAAPATSKSKFVWD